MKKGVLGVACLLGMLSFVTAKSQGSLKIGDKVPDIIFQNVLNSHRKTLRLSEMRGKLVILDMWSIYCSGCLRLFPEMEKLQQRFGEKIQVMLVNSQPRDKESPTQIKAVFDRFEKGHGLSITLPVPVNDTALNTYFPHRSVPHEIWIGGDGRLLAVTGHEQVTAANITAMLNGKKTSLVVKNDWGFDAKLPLFVGDNGGINQQFVYRSLFTPYIGGIGSTEGLRLDSSGRVTGMFLINRLMSQMIEEAYAMILSGMNSNRWIIESNRPSLYSNDYDENNVYCYDLTIPAAVYHGFDGNRYLREDLLRYFKVRVTKTARTVGCWVIRGGEAVQNSVSAFDKREILVDNFSKRKFMHRTPLADIVELIDAYSAIPVLDRSGLAKAEMDIELPEGVTMRDTEKLIEILRHKGFVIEKENQNIDMIILTDKN